MEVEDTLCVASAGFGSETSAVTSGIYDYKNFSQKGHQATLNSHHWDPDQCIRLLRNSLCRILEVYNVS